MAQTPFFCPACDREIAAWAPGPGGRPNARCPNCQSLERHRFLAYLIRSLPGQIGDVRHVLDLAPHAQVRRVLESTFPDARYVGTDLYEPDRAIDVLADITRLPIASGTIDLLICYHVLEHVPDDRAAMRELARVLAPGGLGLLQVPFRPTALTDEDPSLPPEQRAERFGQEDHVRWYGKDFEDRLRESGLAMRRGTPADLVTAGSRQRVGAADHEPVWFIAAGSHVPAVRVPERLDPLGGRTRSASPNLLDRVRSRLPGG